MKRLTFAVGALIGGSSLVCAAEPAGKPIELPPLYSAVLDCLKVPDRDRRLACFEDAATKLKAATERSDIVVVDKDQIRKTKRTLFGLPLPSIDILGGGDEVKEVAGTVAAAHANGDGRWVITLQDGATWQQIDDRVVARMPRAGFSVSIERATMGTFMMRIEKQPGIRVRRLS